MTLAAHRGRQPFTAKSAAEIISALIKPTPGCSEFDLHAAIDVALKTCNVSFEREVILSAQDRIDFLCQDGVGIEVKCGKPQRQAVIDQLVRYAQQPRVQELVIASERNLSPWFTEAKTINGKPFRYIWLTKSLGIAT